MSDDLLAAAAEKSAPLRRSGAAAGDIARWVGTLPAGEKDTLLARVVNGEGARVGAELLRRFQTAQRAANPGAAPTETGRSVAELLESARERADDRKREQARRDAEERARREREAAAAAKRAKEYDQATQLLVDLRDISVPRRTTEAFRARLQAPRLRHATKRTFLDRLDRAALPR